MKQVQYSYVPQISVRIKVLHEHLQELTAIAFRLVASHDRIFIEVSGKCVYMTCSLYFYAIQERATKSWSLSMT